MQTLVEATTPDLPAFATVDKLCEIMSLSRSSIYKLLGNGDLVARRVAGRTLINVAEAVNFANRQPVVHVMPRHRPA